MNGLQRRAGVGGHDYPSEQEQKLLQLALVGAPNAGKSTLTNALVGQKVTAVSRKTNTTALPTLGAITQGVCQVVLYDTPGVVSSSHFKGQARRVESAWSTAASCDLLAFVVDAHRQLAAPDVRVTRLVDGLRRTAEAIAERALEPPSPLPALLIMNKVDLLARGDKARLRKLARDIQELLPFRGLFFTSAQHGQGIPELRSFLLDACTPGEWTLLPDQATDMMPNQLATELVREKLFEYLHQELPYDVQVEHESWQELQDGSARCEQHIIVPNQRVRAMVVGAKGAAIGRVGIAARCELENTLNRKIHLVLKVLARAPHKRKWDSQGGA